jgi:hypothetical protein
MPNEHLTIPQDNAGWKPFREAAREALGEGELAQRWLAENPTKVIGDFARFADKQSPRDPAFENWRTFETETIRDGTTLAATEAATFNKIAAAEEQRHLYPVINDGPLARVADDLRMLPYNASLEDLAARRGLPDRGPWEVACDALGQYGGQKGLTPNDDRYISVLDDARTRMRRAGDLVDGFSAFLRATEIAVATANKETPPSATWANSEYKRRADELLTELRNWDNLVHQDAEPSAQELKTRADACAPKLAALAQECAPAGQFSNTAAFASLNGLATLLAIGERMAAQIASRAGQPTAQTLYDRLSEIPNRAPARPDSPLGRTYNEGYNKLAKTWKDDLARRKSNFQSVGGVDKAFVSSCFDTLQKPIAERLPNWDRLMNDAGDLVNPGGLARLKREVAQLATDLAFMRRIVATTNGMAGGAPMSDGFKAARDDLVVSIDTLAAQMQRRLALAIGIGA